MEEQRVQQDFLSDLCHQNSQVSVFLLSGIQLRGQIKSFDSFVLLLEKNSIVQMVYKHAISTVVRHQPGEEMP